MSDITNTSNQSQNISLNPGASISFDQGDPGSGRFACHDTLTMQVTANTPDKVVTIQSTRTILDTIQSCPIILTADQNGEIVEFTADADIDCDGSGGNPFHDPYFQPDTTLHSNGKALHAEVVPYIVVPPIICLGTKGKVLGCKCIVTNLHNKKWIKAVVGDIGPTRKIGEISPACATAIGLNGNPNHGGTSDRIIHYQIFVGVPATIDGVTYQLQSYRK